MRLVEFRTGPTCAALILTGQRHCCQPTLSIRKSPNGKEAQFVRVTAKALYACQALIRLAGSMAKIDPFKSRRLRAV